MTPELLAQNRAALEVHLDGLPLPADTPTPVLPARFLWLAGFATFWTLGSEALLAAAFLWPGAGGLARWRDGALLLFCASTYAVATIEGFGWLLIAMGVAQCDPGRRRWRTLYLTLFALILVYREIPWEWILGGV